METHVQVSDVHPRFAELRTRDLRLERRVLASMAKVGQRAPVLATRLGGALVLLDGHKRLKAAHQLRLEVLLARVTEVDEVTALVLIAKAHDSAALSPVEEGFILWTLQLDHGLDLNEIAERFERNASFVQRRIALVRDFSTAILDRVRAGALSPAVLRLLAPLAREHPAEAEALARACADAALSTRETARLLAAFLAADADAQVRLLANPRAFLLREDARKAACNPMLDPTAAQLHASLTAIGRQARASATALRSDTLRPLSAQARQSLRTVWLSTQTQLGTLADAANEVLHE